MTPKLPPSLAIKPSRENSKCRFYATACGVLIGLLLAINANPVVIVWSQEVSPASSNDDIGRLWNEALEAESRYDFERALAKLLELESLSSSPAWRQKSRLRRAELLYRDCQESTAFELWESSLKDAPEDAGVRQAMAQVLVEHRDWGKALPIIEQWISLANGESKLKGMLSRGKVLLHTGKTAETLAYYEQLLREVPSNSRIEREVVTQIAEIYGQRISIQALLEKFVELHRELPDRPELASSMSQALLDLEQPRAAIRFCELAVANRPLDRGLNELLLNRLLARDWLEAAEFQVRVMQQRFPDPDSLTLLLADLYFAQKKQIDYLQTMEDYTHRHRHDLKTLQRIARIHRAYDQMLAANAVIQLSVDEHPDSFQALAYAAQWAKEIGNYHIVNQRWSAAWSVARATGNPNDLLELVRGVAQSQRSQLLVSQLGDRPWVDKLPLAEIDELDSYLVDACLFSSQEQKAAEALVIRLHQIRNREQMESCWRQAAQVQDSDKAAPVLANALKTLEATNPFARLLAIELLAREGRIADATQALEVMLAQSVDKTAEIDAAVPVLDLCRFQRIRLARAVDDWPMVSRLTRQAFDDAAPQYKPSPLEVVHDYWISEQPALAMEFIENWKQREPQDWRAWQQQVVCLERLGQLKAASEVWNDAMRRFANQIPSGDPFVTQARSYTAFLVEDPRGTKSVSKLNQIAIRQPDGSTTTPAIYVQRRLESLRETDMSEWLEWANFPSGTHLRRVLAEHDQHRLEHVRVLMRFSLQDPPPTNKLREILAHFDRVNLESAPSSDWDWFERCKALLRMELDIRNDRRQAGIWLELLRGRSVAAIPPQLQPTDLQIPMSHKLWLPTRLIKSQEQGDPFRLRARYGWLLQLLQSDPVVVRQGALLHLLNGSNAKSSPKLIYDLHQCGIPNPTKVLESANRLLAGQVEVEQQDEPKMLVDEMIELWIRGYDTISPDPKTNQKYRAAYAIVKDAYPDLALFIVMRLAKSEPEFESLLTKELERLDQAGSPNLKVISAYAKAAQGHPFFTRTALTPLDRCFEQWLWRWYEQGVAVPQIAEQLGAFYGLHWDEFDDCERVQIFLEREMSLFAVPIRLRERSPFSRRDDVMTQRPFLSSVSGVAFRIPQSLEMMFYYSRLPSWSSKDDSEREIVAMACRYLEKHSGSFQNPRLRLFAAWMLVRDFYYSGQGHDKQVGNKRLANLKEVLDEVLLLEPEWAEA